MADSGAQTSVNNDPVRQLADRVIAGDMPALARTISLIEAGHRAAQPVLGHLRQAAGNALVVGFTGPPGAGKSTLINAYISALRGDGRRVAVLAVDPSSPLTGGAVLGDRTRMGDHSLDDGVFIRSLSARGHLGGLSAEIHAVIDAVDAAGWNIIVLETVGAGQSETEVAEIADRRVVISVPGLGDDVQAIKAGILEIADVLVVNKSDLPLAERTERQLRSMLALRADAEARVPIVRTVATKGEGLDELVSTIAENGMLPDGAERRARLIRRARRLIAAHAAQMVKQALDATDGDLDDICGQLIDGDMSLDEAARHAQSVAGGAGQR